MLLKSLHDLVGRFLGVIDLLLELRREEFITIAAKALGAIKRDVGVHQRLFGIVLVVTEPGYADTGPEATKMPLVGNGLTKGGDDGIGHFHDVGSDTTAAAKNDKLVAANPGHEIIGLHQSGQGLGGVDEHRVPGLMTERVVDLFETIQIDMENCGVLQPLAGKIIEPLIEIASIGKTPSDGHGAHCIRCETFAASSS